jgi:hypothetical protein
VSAAKLVSRAWFLATVGALALLSVPALATPAEGPPEASTAQISQNFLRVGRAYQPTLFVDRDDRFWPASFLNVFSLTWDNRFTCLVTARTGQQTCGAAGRPLSMRVLPPARGGRSDYLDYPATLGDIDDRAKSFQQNVAGPETSARTYFFAGYGRRAAGAIASFQY